MVNEMKADTEPFTSLQRSVKLDLPDGTTKYANSNSYIKARRRAAKEERRNKIRDLLDSSLEDVNYQLPDFSDSDGPIVPLTTPVIKRKSKNLLPKSFHSPGMNKSSSDKTRRQTNNQLDGKNTSSCIDDLTSPMEDLLKELESSGVVESDATSYTHMMSSSSFAFNMSSQCLSVPDELESYAESDTCGEECQESINYMNINDCSGGIVQGSDHLVRENKQGETAEEEEITNTGDKEGVVDYVDYVDEEIEEEIVDSDDESYYEEIVVDDVDTGSHVLIEEEEYFSDEEIIDEESQVCDENEIIEYFSEEEVIEEIIEDYDDYSVEEDFDFDEEIIEEIIGESDDSDEDFVEEEYEQDSQNSEASLGIIDEEEYDSDSSDNFAEESRPRMYAPSVNSLVCTEEICEGSSTNIEIEEEVEEEEDEEYIEEEESLSSSFLCENELDRDFYTYDDHDDSFIEEEIISEFDVPVIPAIAAWQKKQEELLAIGEEPPEVAARTPREILMAVLAAAAMDFKLRKVPEDHKKCYTPLCVSAACLGRLTKLDEYVIEDQGRAPAVRTDDEWRPTGAPIIFTRSISLRIATEAAAMGRVMRLKEKVVTNYDNSEPHNVFEEEHKVDIDDLLDEKGRPIFRTSVLVPFHERDTKQATVARDWKLGILEESCEVEEGITVDNVNLPTRSVPCFQKPVACSPVMSREEIKDAIARGVAEGAWNRKYRLERPQVKLRITTMCRCKYCENPNAFQTHAYKKLRQILSQ